jgi:dTDP-4-dehydrorhamnose 3,5-epimerase
MRFAATSLDGVYLIDLERHEDERGTFARTYCADEFAAHGLDAAVVQCNTSFNRLAGTMRGLHFQAGSAGETKLVRCTRGAIFDVVVDLRHSSSTYLQYVAVELTADSGRSVYVPPGFAHGFETLLDETEVLYQMGQRHAPGAERGIHFDDPALSIRWPLPVKVISVRDANLPTVAHRDSRAARRD